ncbi:hypothetical protein TanjilG_02887 [Lupinus angustifolius]|uniref:Uncharacterized protein n=1 Tax=Lupinus angustifolius TaxID=3871 RepID=A0A4P1QP72_LUPAN|nr:hypothetical protein TanjilG_02887 [Lupinus angustifolius]
MWLNLALYVHTHPTTTSIHQILFSSHKQALNNKINSIESPNNNIDVVPNQPKHIRLHNLANLQEFMVSCRLRSLGCFYGFLASKI